MKKKHRPKQTRRDETLFSLIDTMIETNGGLAVAPPKKLRKDWKILVQDDVVEQLQKTKWKIVFRNGRREKLDFGLLMILLWVLEDIKRQVAAYDEALELGDCQAEMRLKVAFDESKIMRPKVVRRLLKELLQRKGMG